MTYPILRSITNSLNTERRYGRSACCRFGCLGPAGDDFRHYVHCPVIGMALETCVPAVARRLSFASLHDVLFLTADARSDRSLAVWHALLHHAHNVAKHSPGNAHLVQVFTARIRELRFRSRGFAAALLQGEFTLL